MPASICGQCGHSLTGDNIQVPTSSPTPELLHEDGAASISQSERLIRSTLSTALSNISTLDNEISRIETVLKDLQRKREDLQKHTHHLHVSLLAPACRLPPEVVSEIFLHCMRPDRLHRGNFYYEMRLDKTPLLLAGICSRWRSIALSTRRLWTSIVLLIRPKYLRSDTALMKVWLARSGTCPLSLSLCSVGHFKNNMRSLMQVFLLHCERWENVYLDLSISIFNCLASAKNRLPRLQTLTLDFSDELETSSETIDTFEAAPQLHSLMLAYSIEPASFLAPWSQLKHCDVHQISTNTDECLDLLRLTPNLEECSLLVPSTISSHSHSTLQLPRLCILSIKTYKGHSDIIGTLQLPMLTQLTINLHDLTQDVSLQLVNLLSHCSLEKFSFSTELPPSHDDLLTQTLHAMPSLVELSFGECGSKHMTIAFLKSFARNHSSALPNLVPKLRKVTIKCRWSYFDILAFADAIESRISLDKTCDLGLQTVLISVDESSMGSEAMASDSVARIRQLRHIGLDIKFYHLRKDLLD